MAWPNLPYGNGPSEWNTIRELLRSAANYDFANGQIMTIKGTVCGNVANASSVQGNGNYSNTGTVLGTQWVGPTGPIHSTYTSQAFDCQWYTPGTSEPGCVPDPKNEPSDQLFVDIAIASNTAKALTPTQTYTGIDTNSGDVTINVVSGLNVINVPPNPYGTTEGKLQVRGTGNLIISGPSDAVVIFNVGADNQVNAVRNGMSIENGRSILVTGGVQAQNILFNVIGGDITINAGVVNGNILVRAGSDVKGKADIQGTSRINGVVIGDGNHSSEFSLAEGAIICATILSMDVQKDVSPDNGITWYPADTPPGPNVIQGTNPQFRFTVTNTSNVTLTNVVVTDDVYGPIGTLPSLAPGVSFTWTITQPWLLGQHVNTVTATGNYEGQTVTASNPAYWVGVEAPGPAIYVQKDVSPDNGVTWYPADTPPGPTVTQGTNPQFRFIVTNTGNVTLSNVVVTDNVYGPIGTLPSLAPGASFTWIITQPWLPGQQVNTATATGDYAGQTVTASNPAYWVGVEAPAPAIDVRKDVSPDNGVTWYPADALPGPNVVQGTNPQFRFTVTNTGNVTLANVGVTDDVYGPIGTLPSLAPGASFTWIITRPWLPGQQANTATATGAYAGQTLTASNPAYWVGVEAPGPAIYVQKDVSPDNGVTWYPADTPPGPTVTQGTNPQFRFIVTNTGNVTLSNVVVTDNVYGPIGTLPSLAPGASSTWIITQPWLPGQQVNTATATGDYQGQTVTASNPAYWVGVEEPVPAIDVLKDVSSDNGVTWYPADTSPGPDVIQGTNPQFRFTVTNTGNVTLFNVVVTDDVYGPIGTLPSLAPGSSFTWTITRPWLPGQQVNTATATGNYQGQTVTASNPAYWVGIEVPAPAIDVQKDVSPDNGVTWYPADTPPGSNVVQGTNPQFRFIVTNTGNVTLSNIIVTDDVYGQIGTLPSLAPGASFTWIITRPWLLGQQVNTATATGDYAGQTVTASNPAYWVGVETPAPSIGIEKLISLDNGVTFEPANTSPGPLVPEGVTPQFKLVVTNTGNVALANITVTDVTHGFATNIPIMLPGEVQEFVIP